MHTKLQKNDDKVQFIIVDAPEKYHEVIRALAYSETEAGFMKSFPADTPHLDRAYQNFEQHIGTIIKQSAGEAPVPLEEAFEAFLKRTYHLNTDWWVAGSVPLWLRGFDVQPGDIDLIVDSEGAIKWGNALSDAMIEPVAITGGWFCEFWGRAFLHARIEWTGGIDPENDFSYVREYYLPSVDKLETINWKGYDIRIPPVEPQLKMDEMRGRTEHVRKIRETMKSNK